MLIYTVTLTTTYKDVTAKRYIATSDGAVAGLKFDWRMVTYVGMDAYSSKVINCQPHIRIGCERSA